MTEREVFFAALEMATPEARAAYLLGACRGDVTLRRQVDELLKEHFSNDSLPRQTMRQNLADSSVAQ